MIAWIAVYAVAVGLRRDRYPLRLLNLAFSTQAAYAAPLILLAKTRQVAGTGMLDRLEAHREGVMSRIQEREVASRKEIADLKLDARGKHGVDPGGQGPDERVEALTREIRARLPSAG